VRDDKFGCEDTAGVRSAIDGIPVEPLEYKT